MMSYGLCTSARLREPLPQGQDNGRLTPLVPSESNGQKTPHVHDPLPGQVERRHAMTAKDVAYTFNDEKTAPGLDRGGGRCCHASPRGRHGPDELQQGGQCRTSTNRRQVPSAEPHLLEIANRVTDRSSPGRTGPTREQDAHRRTSPTRPPRNTGCRGLAEGQDDPVPDTKPTTPANDDLGQRERAVGVASKSGDQGVLHRQEARTSIMVPTHGQSHADPEPRPTPLKN